MPIIMWDASGVSKRYITERGSATVNALFAMQDSVKMVATIPGYGETFSILQRRLNSGVLNKADHAAAERLLRLELVEDVAFQLLAAEAHIFACLPLIRRHNINSSDAAILATYLDYQRSVPPADQQCVLVASDTRLLRAAVAEGLAVLNPETMAPGDVAAFLNAL